MEFYFFIGGMTSGPSDFNILCWFLHISKPCKLVYYSKEISRMPRRFKSHSFPLSPTFLIPLEEIRKKVSLSLKHRNIHRQSVSVDSGTKLFPVGNERMSSDKAWNIETVETHPAPNAIVSSLQPSPYRLVTYPGQRHSCCVTNTELGVIFKLRCFRGFPFCSVQCVSLTQW